MALGPALLRQSGMRGSFPQPIHGAMQHQHSAPCERMGRKLATAFYHVSAFIRRVPTSRPCR